jgi:hypothetical protein
VVRDDWADHLLVEAGRWWCATRAWRGRADLAPPDLGDLRAYLGWAVPTDDVRAGDSLADRWVVLGVHRTDDGRLQQQRTWLHGSTTHETVVVLDFAVVGGALGVAKVVGSVLEATVARYPGRGTRRALFADEPRVVAVAPDVPATVAGGRSIDDALAVAADGLAANPWFDRSPVALRSVAVVPAEPVEGPAERGKRDVIAGPLVVDGDDRALALVPEVSPWPILARTGGRPVDVFAEVEGGRLRPLTIAVAGELVAV